jgi:hypothetical protein
MLYLRLESIRPAENRFRYYIVVIAPTLWGTYGILCQWGRLDQRPRGMRVVEAGDLDAARAAMAGIVEVRLRHGYKIKQPPG